MQTWAVINLTPDSFVPSSQVAPENFENTANRFLEEGADILDIGAESSRPYADPVDEAEEIRRLAPLAKLAKTTQGRAVLEKISVDTYKAGTAKFVLELGVPVINDIRGGQSDELLKAVAGYGAKVVLMHSQGDSQTMQNNPVYKDAVTEIIDFLKIRTQKAIGLGVKKENIIWDFGVGFGKTIGHNLALLSNIARFKEEGYPILAGISRKSFIGKLLNLENVEERKDPTLVLHTYLALQGVDILRVHDVVPVVQMKSLLRALETNRYNHG